MVGQDVKLILKDSEVHALVACPVCFGIMLSPIFQCESGHVVCNNCLKRVRHCPICRAQMTEVRNRFAEIFLDKCEIACRYKDEGCYSYFSGSQLGDHQSGSCHFRPITCILCSMEVPYSDFLEHMEHVEELVKQEAALSVTLFTSTNYCTWKPTWILAYDLDFFLFMEPAGGVWWVWLAGFATSEEIAGYHCAIYVKSKVSNVELRYQGDINTVRCARNEVLESARCLAIMKQALPHYVNEDGLSLSVVIKKKK